MALGLVFVAGCAPTELSRRGAAYHPRKARIVFMPAMVALYTLSSEGQMVHFGDSGHPEIGADIHLEFQEARSKAVRQTIDRWLKTYVEEHDSRIAKLEEVAPTRLPANAFYSVMEEVTNQIVVDWLDHPWAPKPLSHWGREGRFEGWESALEADYVVFVKFKGAYEAPGQNPYGTGIVNGNTRIFARRIAVLAVVDVRSGRIVSVQGIKFEALLQPRSRPISRRWFRRSRSNEGVGDVDQGSEVGALAHGSKRGSLRPLTPVAFWGRTEQTMDGDVSAVRRARPRPSGRHGWISMGGLVFLSLTLAATARAQPAGPDGSNQAVDEERERAPDPGARAHDGFYLRLHLGPGYTNLSASPKGGDLSLAGESLSFGIALGGSVSSHLIIYGTLVDTLVFNLTSKQDGASTEPGMIESFVYGGGLSRMGVLGIGGGAAYYLDTNVFFAGSLLGSRASVSDFVGMVVRSQWGLTFEGLVGKEWWVSANWGLGVAGQVLLGAMNDTTSADASVPTWKLAAFSVLFSATFN